MALLVEILSMYTNYGDRVLDPFCGTGSLGVACQLYQREFVGIERDGNIVPPARAWNQKIEDMILEDGHTATAQRLISF